VPPHSQLEEFSSPYCDYVFFLSFANKKLLRQ
jgi:hypothetical protein